jgi:hypothetical protein
MPNQLPPTRVGARGSGPECLRPWLYPPGGRPCQGLDGPGRCCFGCSGRCSGKAGGPGRGAWGRRFGWVLYRQRHWPHGWERPMPQAAAPGRRRGQGPRDNKTGTWRAREIWPDLCFAWWSVSPSPPPDPSQKGRGQFFPAPARLAARRHEASFKVPSTSWRSPPGCRRLFAITAEALSFKESPMESSVFHAGDKDENRCLW